MSCSAVPHYHLYLGRCQRRFLVPAMPGKYKMTQGSTLGIYLVLEWNG